MGATHAAAIQARGRTGGLFGLLAEPGAGQAQNSQKGRQGQRGVPGLGRRLQADEGQQAHHDRYPDGGERRRARHTVGQREIAVCQRRQVTRNPSGAVAKGILLPATEAKRSCVEKTASK